MSLKLSCHGQYFECFGKEIRETYAEEAVIHLIGEVVMLRFFGPLLQKRI